MIYEGQSQCTGNGRITSSLTFPITRQSNFREPNISHFSQNFGYGYGYQIWCGQLVTTHAARPLPYPPLWVPMALILGWVECIAHSCDHHQHDRSESNSVAFTTVCRLRVMRVNQYCEQVSDAERHRLTAISTTPTNQNPTKPKGQRFNSGWSVDRYQ